MKNGRTLLRSLASGFILFTSAGLFTGCRCAPVRMPCWPWSDSYQSQSQDEQTAPNEMPEQTYPVPSSSGESLPAPPEPVFGDDQVLPQPSEQQREAPTPAPLPEEQQPVQPQPNPAPTTDTTELEESPYTSTTPKNVDPKDAWIPNDEALRQSQQGDTAANEESTRRMSGSRSLSSKQRSSGVLRGHTPLKDLNESAEEYREGFSLPGPTPKVEGFRTRRTRFR